MSRSIALAVAALSVTALMSPLAEAGCRGGGGHGRSSGRLSIAYHRNVPHMRSHAPRNTNHHYRAPVRHTPVYHPPVAVQPVVHAPVQPVVQPVIQPVVTQPQVVAPPAVPTFAPAPQATPAPAVQPAPAPAPAVATPAAQPAAEKSPEELALEALAAFAD